MNDFVQRPEYQGIFDALAEEMAARAAAGEPVGVTIWDGNHGSAVPREIFADPRLNSLLSEYGQPVYIAEEASSFEMNGHVEDYRQADAAGRAAMAEDFLSPYGSSVASNDPLRGGVAMEQLFEHLGNGADLYYPDTRGDLMADAMAMDGSQHYGPFRDYVLTYMPQGYSGDELYEAYRDSLPEADRAAFTGFTETLSNAMAGLPADAPRRDDGVLDTTYMDAEMAGRISDHLAAADGPQATATMYGMAHFTKQDDLDEALGGISVAVVDGPGSIGFLRDNEASAAVHNDLPDYAYYIQEGRLERLDTPAAQSEFLGESPDQAAFREAVMTLGGAATAAQAAPAITPQAEVPQTGPEQLTPQSAPATPGFDLPPDVMAKITACGEGLKASGASCTTPEEQPVAGETLTPAAVAAAAGQEAAAAYGR